MLVSYRPLAKNQKCTNGESYSEGRRKKTHLGRDGHVLAVPVEPVNIQLVRR